MSRWAIITLMLGASLLAVAAAKENSGGTAAAVVAPTTQAHDLRLEGEERFRTNCGRCHQAPHKFPPRMMGTIVRHMRVRAMLTDEDMKSILAYMTE